MTDNANDFHEQLSAFMDGELPLDQARFLLQRMRHDHALRKRWERLQLAAACVRGLPVRLANDDLATRIAAVVAQPLPPTRHARGGSWRDFGLAAAVALAVLLLPRWGSEQGTRELVAAPATVAPAESRHELPSIESLIASGGDAQISPATSVGEFPLLLNDQPKPWPKSPLLGSSLGSSSGMQVGHNRGRADEQDPNSLQDRRGR